MKAKKYPLKIRLIMKEAPMYYSMLAVMDYRKGSAGANELYRRWLIDKENMKLVKESLNEYFLDSTDYDTYVNMLFNYMDKMSDLSLDRDRILEIPEIVEEIDKGRKDNVNLKWLSRVILKMIENKNIL